MVAFRCKCGKSTTDVMLTIPAEKPGYVYVACSQECVDKYGESEV